MSTDPKKEQLMAKRRDDIVQLVQSGDSYTAIEKTLIYVRQMKKINELEDALIFMMQIALTLFNQRDWHASAVCAYRAISQFPSDSKTIRKVLKQLFFNYAEKASPETACPELFGFYRKLSTFFHDKEEDLLLKQASIADQANNYYYAQTFYSELIIKYVHLPNEEEQQRNEKIDNIISLLSTLIWRWIKNQNTENEKQQINISQYIYARCVLLILTIHNENVIEVVQKFVALFKSSPPDNIDAETIFNLPLFHFIDFFIKAIDKKSKKTADYLMKKYEPALNVDSDLLEYANTAKETLNSRDTSGLSGLGSMLQNFLGRMLSGNDNNQ